MLEPCRQTGRGHPVNPSEPRLEAVSLLRIADRKNPTDPHKVAQRLAPGESDLWPLAQGSRSSPRLRSWRARVTARCARPVPCTSHARLGGSSLLVQLR